MTRLTTTQGLKAGDIVMVSVELTDKTTGSPFWWRRFCAVYQTPWVSSPWHVEVLTLKLHVDMHKDLREVDLRKDVVTRVDVASQPQGVSAMLMKLIHTGVIRIEGDE